MRVVIDNTAVHSVGRCLEGKGKGFIDMLGLLQLATQLILCEKLTVGHYECAEVEARTDAVLDRITAAGFPSGAIERRTYTPESYSKHCLNAAADFATDFADLLPQEPAVLEATAPDFGDPQIIPDVGLHQLIASDRSKAELEERAASAAERHAPGLVEYCVAGFPALWKAMRQAYKHRGEWPPEISGHLAVLLRIYANDASAHDAGAHYAPAVGRARFLRCCGNAIQARLTGLVDDTVRKLTRRPLVAPSVHLALARRAKGDPVAVLSEACALRDKAGPLRAMLADVVQRLQGGNEAGWLAFERKCIELSGLLESDLGIGAAPRFRDAIDVAFILGFPAPSLSGKALFEWLRLRWKRKKIAVLTDLSKTAAFGDKVDICYKRLLRNSSSAPA